MTEINEISKKIEEYAEKHKDDNNIPIEFILFEMMFKYKEQRDELLEKCKDIYRVLNQDNTVPNLNWIKNSLQKAIQKTEGETDEKSQN